MEPLDTDFEYVVQKTREAYPEKRFNWLYILPALGVLWVLFLTLAVVFQLDISTVVNPIMGIMIAVFLVFAGALFWALAPRAGKA
jgi:hypothetical protein